MLLSSPVTSPATQQLPLFLPDFRLLVTGWRAWPRAAANVVHWALETVVAEHVHTDQNVVVVDGQCPYGGADDYAHEWAVAREPRCRSERHPAERGPGGEILGPARNERMVDLGADFCLAFMGPDSRGTKNCVRLAKEAGIPGRTIHWNPLFLDPGFRLVPLDSTPTYPHTSW